MGRPEKPITTDGPVAVFALKLRALRRAAGGLNGERNYSTMADITKANNGVVSVEKRSAAALSQAASGNRLPSWETTVAFLVGCGIADLDEIERWRLDWQATNLAVKACGESPGAARVVPLQRHPIEIEGGSVAQETVSEVVYPEVVVGQLPMVESITFRVGSPSGGGLAPPVRLTGPATMDQLVAALNDLVAAQGYSVSRRSDLDRLSDVPLPPAGWRYLISPQVRQVLTGIRRPTRGIVMAIAQACGAAVPEVEEWGTTWARIDAAERNLTGVCTGALILPEVVSEPQTRFSTAGTPSIITLVAIIAFALGIAFGSAITVLIAVLA